MFGPLGNKFVLCNHENGNLVWSMKAPAPKIIFKEDENLIFKGETETVLASNTGEKGAVKLALKGANVALLNSEKDIMWKLIEKS